MNETIRDKIPTTMYLVSPDLYNKINAFVDSLNLAGATQEEIDVQVAFMFQVKPKAVFRLTTFPLEVIETEHFFYHMK